MLYVIHMQEASCSYVSLNVGLNMFHLWFAGGLTLCYTPLAFSEDKIVQGCLFVEDSCYNNQTQKCLVAAKEFAGIIRC